ncbi:hypothetical protein O181_018560 [Austropuccinia psidii MF-1]|uniref:Uncharacterized protein n=1 Tax=Austropuccinia psidii MF-1 TaxID=1389203 RepID=A0A9Q3CA27_9BASI|nr:hypothetical protein [Austropuccinia psidii MF-1]
MKIIQEIQFFNNSINVELGKIDEKIAKITSDVNDFKNNDTDSAKFQNSKIDRLDIICRTCDRIQKIVKHTNQLATHLARSDSERLKLKDEILAHVEKIHKNYEPSPHIPRNSTPFTEEKHSLNGILVPFLGENAISANYIPRLEEWPKFSGEGEYYHIEFIRTIDMFQEDFNVSYETIMGKLQSLFTKTAKKWYDKMRQDHGNNDWSGWKSELVTKWTNNSWRFRRENSF